VATKAGSALWGGMKLLASSSSSTKWIILHNW
jgi:hypothetical protein